MRTASFTTPFKVPERLDAFIIEAKVAEYRTTRCETLRDEIIESHMRLALTLAGRFMVGNMHRQDDLISAALLGLTQAVTWAPDRLYDNNIAPYIVKTVIRHLRDFMQQDQIVTIERREFRKMMESSGTAGVSVVPYFHPVGPSEDDEENYAEAFEADNVPPICVDDPIEIDELRDFLCFDKQESIRRTMLELLNLLEEGFTYEEIASEFGLSKQRIHQYVQGLRQRYRYWVANHERIENVAS